MAELTFHDILAREAIAPTDVAVVLHSPTEPELLSVLQYMLKGRLSEMEAYQATQGARAAATLKRGRRWVAAFVKVAQDVPPSHSQMLFAGMHRNEGWRVRNVAEIMTEPEIEFLSETYGTHSEFASLDETQTAPWFALVLDERMTGLQGRLVLSVRLTQTCGRLGETFDPSIRAIHLESTFDADPPDWRTWVLTAAELQALPPGWAARLREWRGVYLIRDRTDGARYVGSAYGVTNLLGRWQEHVRREAGVTVGLASRNPKNFDFSILEAMAPTAAAEDVIAVEHAWMTRLHTRTHGLDT